MFLRFVWYYLGIQSVICQCQRQHYIWCTFSCKDQKGRRFSFDALSSHLATWFTTGAKFVGPYSCTVFRLWWYASKIPSMPLQYGFSMSPFWKGAKLWKSWTWWLQLSNKETQDLYQCLLDVIYLVLMNHDMHITNNLPQYIRTFSGKTLWIGNKTSWWKISEQIIKGDIRRGWLYQRKLVRNPSVGGQFGSKAQSGEHLVAVVVLNYLPYSLQGHGVGVQRVGIHVVQRSRLRGVT